MKNHQLPVAHRAQSSWRRGGGGDGQSFFVVPVPSPLQTGSLGQANTHEGLTDFIHGSRPAPPPPSPFPDPCVVSYCTCSFPQTCTTLLARQRPFLFLPGVIMVPAFDRLLPIRTGHRRAGRDRHRDVQNSVRVELYMAARACFEIIKPCLQSTASYLCVLVTTLEDGAVEPSRMPFESSCPSLRLSWN
ncbi:uncharacterized protein LOC144161662 [Haemaphysalis longicornis]